MRDYKDLQVWQRSIDFVVAIYDLIASFPAEEKHALADQMRRAVVSIPSNIAEGMERASVKEKVHFISIAIASLAEIETQLIICGKVGYLNQSQYASHLEEIISIRKMLYRLSANLKKLTTSN